MRRTVTRALAVRSAADRGAQVLGQVGSAVGRGYRNWTTPGAALRRKVRSAQRRRTIWAGTGVVAGGYGGYQIAGLFDGSVTAFEVVIGLLMVALFVRCAIGVYQAAVDLRRRRAQLAELPPAPPVRGAVDSNVRREIDRLDGYSDGLRRLVAMIGLDPSSRDTAELRVEIIAAADAAETHLRESAGRYTELVQMLPTAPPEATGSLSATAEVLRRRITSGVAGYGDLVTAAGETVHASHVLQQPGAGTGEAADRLQALALGMTELARGTEPA